MAAAHLSVPQPSCQKLATWLSAVAKERRAVMDQIRIGLLGLIHDLILVSDSEGLDRRKLTLTLNYSINLIKTYFERLKPKSKPKNDQFVAMTMNAMFNLLGLHTEPRVVDLPEIKPETIHEYLETNKISLKTEPDYTIMTHDRSYLIKCHKLILYAKWPYFRRMIESGLLESAKVEMIMPEDWNATRLFDFVKYLYTHHVGFQSLQDSVWLLNNSELYGLMQKPKDQDRQSTLPKQDFELLYHTCRRKLFEPINTDNCVAMYKLSIQIGLEERRIESYSFLVSNVVELMKNEKTAVQLLEFGTEFIGKLLLEHNGYGVS